MTEDQEWVPLPSVLKQIERLFRAYDTPFGLNSDAMYDKADGYVLACRGVSVDAVKKAVDEFISGSAERKRSKRSTLPTSDEFGAHARALDKALKLAGPEGSKVFAPPFGPLWGVKVYRLLSLGPDSPLPPASRFIQSVIDDPANERSEEYRLHHQAKVGFGVVNAMFDLASSGKGWRVEEKLQVFMPLLSPVPVGSDAFKDWRAIHADRGWPWFPHTGAQRVIYLPNDGDAIDTISR